jgi:putative transposase
VGKKTGRNPTDRGKLGVKRSLLTDRHGIPLAAVIDGANRNDHTLMRQTLEALPIERPKPTHPRPQHLCLDKGFDYAEPRALAEEFGFTLHLRSRGEEAWAKRHARAKARRWVVERTHSWLNRFRSILIRWAKKPANYLSLLHFVFGIICWRYALAAISHTIYWWGDVGCGFVEIGPLAGLRRRWPELRHWCCLAT